MINQVEELIGGDLADHLFSYAVLTKTKKPDTQIEGTMSGYAHPPFEILLMQLQPKIEQMYGKPLVPTYSMFRVYKPGDELKRHIDRQSCQVSATLCLGWHNIDYMWPIFVAGVPLGMNKGQGVVYKGCDQVHWRDPLVGPEDAVFAQVFLHYIEKGGEFDPEFAFDKRDGLNFDDFEGGNREREHTDR